MKHKTKTDTEKKIREDLAKKVHETVQKYKKQRDAVRAYIEKDPKIPIREKQANRRLLLIEVPKLKALLREVMPHIRKIRSLIDDPLDQTRLVACYFLFGKVSQGLTAIFGLLANGFAYEAMEIVRSNREALDLIYLFLNEPDDSAIIKKWFDGEIVSNVIAREAAEKQLESFSLPTISVAGMKGGIYAALSKYTHMSYGALIEAFDVYREDFDFDRIAGHHFALKSDLPYVRGEIHGMIIALKAFYKSMGDRKTYLVIDAILRKHAPIYNDEEARKKRNAALVAKYGTTT